MTPNCEPKQLSVGDTWKWTRNFPDYPASAGWALTYSLRNAAQKIDITTTPNGDAFDVLVSASTTGAYVAGDYTWAAYAEMGSERYTADSGRTAVLPNLGVDNAVDGRSYNEKMLDAIRATIAGGASTTVAEYTIGGRSIKYLSTVELRSQEQIYALRVSRERGLMPKSYVSRFSRVS